MDAHTLFTTGLAWARCSGLVLAAPAWGLPGIGVRVKLVLSGLMALAIWPAAERALHATTLPLPLLFASELAAGAALGLIASLVVAGIRQGGELVAMQAGLAPASVISVEPQWDSDVGTTPFGHLFSLLALVVFLGWNGPMLLVDALARSYQQMPPGFVPVATITGDGVRPEAITFVCRMLNGAVVLAFQAAAPMGLALLVAGFVMAFLARGQGRSLSGMAWPLRWVLAVVLFVACLPGLVALLQSSWRACAHDITTLSHQ